MSQLQSDGFIIVSGPLAGFDLISLAAAYDKQIATAAPDQVHAGSTSIRLDLVNTDPIFDQVYTHPPLLAAATEIIGAPYKLSAFCARSVRPHAFAQDLHQDFPRLPDGWPMVGFILMVDEFCEENGGTRFIGGSHKLTELSPDLRSDSPECRTATGPAGSMIIFNGSVMHGHGANLTAATRRSIQGALIRHDQQASIDHVVLTRPQTRTRLSSLHLKLLGYPDSTLV